MNGTVLMTETSEGPGSFSSYDQKDPSSQHNWQKSMEAAIPAIVVIRVCAVRPFDGQGANFSYATGFVVDKEQGIILTNRHVVTAGPVTADAVFLNKEEIDLVPIYRVGHKAHLEEDKSSLSTTIIITTTTTTAAIPSLLFYLPSQTHFLPPSNQIPLQDPVHDFGFCKFDPKKLKYLAPTEIELDPDGRLGCFWDGPKDELIVFFVTI